MQASPDPWKVTQDALPFKSWRVAGVDQNPALESRYHPLNHDLGRALGTLVLLEIEAQLLACTWNFELLLGIPSSFFS